MDGRDYSMYLAPKTINKQNAASQQFCPKCHKRLRRLRVSATCKDIPSVSPPPPVAGHSSRGQENSDTIDLSAILNFTPPACTFKPRSKLPSTQEEWDDANTYFLQAVLPQVIALSSPDSKYAALSDGIYDYFANKYGTKQQTNRRRRQEKLTRALNQASEKKNEARKQLHRAKTAGAMSPAEILCLAKRFYELVRAHNRCKKAHQ